MRSKMIGHTGNADQKYESPTSYGSKVMIKVNVFKMKVKSQNI